MKQNLVLHKFSFYTVKQQSSISVSSGSRGAPEARRPPAPKLEHTFTLLSFTHSAYILPVSKLGETLYLFISCTKTQCRNNNYVIIEQRN